MHTIVKKDKACTQLKWEIKTTKWGESLEATHKKTEDSDKKMSEQKSRSAKCIIHTPTNRCMLSYINIVSYRNTFVWDGFFIFLFYFRVCGNDVKSTGAQIGPSSVSV